MITRPANEEELQKREAIGTIRASRFVRQYAKSNAVIDVSVIYEIHRQIFKDAWPDIAGVLRSENLEITDSKHLPPHHSEVERAMSAFDQELKDRLGKIVSVGGAVVTHDVSDDESTMFDRIIETAAWVHHKITSIHPFRDGNGRTARLITNLILERYGLVGISIKIERENKNSYRMALQQIDQYGDYEPLKDSIAQGIIDRYNGIPMKLS